MGGGTSTGDYFFPDRKKWDPAEILKLFEGE